MADDLNTEIKIGADATGVEAGVGRAKRSLKDLGDTANRAARDAGDGLSKVGAGGDKAAADVGRATKNIEGQLQRAIAAFEGGERGSRKFYESLASQRGADVATLKPLLDQLDAYKAKAQAAAQASDSISFEKIGASVKSMAQAFTLATVAVKAAEVAVQQVGTAIAYAVDSAKMAARYETLGVVMQTVGRNAGYTGQQMHDAAKGVQALGITMLESRDSITKMASAQIDLANASKLARIAQDAAVIGGVNSSEALKSMVYGIQSAQTDVLRTIGINVSFEESYKKLADQIGTTTEALTEQEKTTARTNAVLESGAKIAGAYEDAMGTAGKQMTSMSRYSEDAKVKLGAVFNESLLLAIATYTGHLKESNENLDKLTQNKSLDTWSQDMASTFAFLADSARNSFSVITGSLDTVYTAMLQVSRFTVGDYKGLVDAGKGWSSRMSGRFDPNNQMQVQLDNLRAKREQDAKTLTMPDKSVIVFETPEQKSAYQDGLAGIRKFLDDRQKAVDKAGEATTAALKKNRTAQQKVEDDILSYRKAQTAAGIDLASAEVKAAEAAIRARGKTESGAAGESQVAGIRAKIVEQTRYLELLRTQGAEADKLSEGEKLVIKIKEDLKTSIKGVARSEKERALAAAEALAVVDKQVAGEQERIKGLERAKQAYAAVIDEARKTASAISTQADELEASNSMWGKGKVAIEEYRLALIKAKLAQVEGGSDSSYDPAYVSALMAQVEAQERKVNQTRIADFKTLNQHSSELLRNAREQASLYQDEFGIASLTALERAKVVAHRQVELKYAKELEKVNQSSANDVEKDELRQRLADAKRIEGSAAIAKVVQEDWAKTADQINQSLTDALLRGFEAGKGFAQNLRDTVVNMFRTMVLRPVIQATIHGGMNALGLGPAAGGQGGGLMGMANNASSLNSLWGAGSQAMYGGAAGASAASLGYANAVGMVGGDAIGALAAANGGWAGVSTGAALTEAYGAAVAVEAGTAAATAGAAGATAGATAGISAGLAAIPGWGWAAMAAIAVFGLSGKGGGPKTESGGGYSGGRSGMNLGGPAADYAKGIQDSYASLAKSLGIASNLTVGAYTSQDPAGDSLTQLHVAGSINGASVYDRADRVGNIENVGRSDAELQAALAEEATRVLFGALKASDLPEQYKAYLNTVADGAAAMQAAIEKVVGVKQFTDALNTLPFDNLKNLAFDASDSLLTLSGSLDNMLGSLKSYHDLYYSDAERLALSQSTMADTLAKVGLVLPETKNGFRELVNGMDLTTESSRIAYMTLLKLAPEFAATADGLAVLAKTAAADLFKSFFDAAKINFTGLSGALAGVDYSTFTEAVGLVFDNLAGRIKSVIDGIAAERNAVAEARLKILDPGAMSKDAILRGIADASVSAPTNAALVAAQSSLGGADAEVAAQAAAVARAKAMTPSSAALDSARSTLNVAKASTDAAQAFVDEMRGYGNGNFNWFMDQAYAGNDLRGTVPNPSGEMYAQNSVFGLLAAQRNEQPAQAAYDAALAAYSAALAVNAGKVAEAQAILTAATADQSAAVLVARQAQLAYIASLQDFAIDAGKSVTKLGKLREETLKYYEAQKQLADLMTNSAAGLRESVRVARMGQLDSAQSLAQRQADFQSNYSLALATTGATQAGYADKLAAALPDLSVALMDTASTREEWALATAALLAQSEAIAGKLEANTPTDYVAESLAMLTSIDTTLAALEASATTAEKIIADAVAAGSEKTASGLRAVIAALTGQTLPAFAAGGHHGGGLRIVGERGWEVEATGPSRIFNQQQLGQALRGGGTGNVDVVAELRALRAETQATAGHTNKIARLLERVMPDGDAIATREATV